MQRYYSERPIAGPHVELHGDEARHLGQVMRGQPGQLVVLLDGSGAEFDARIEQVGRSKVELTIVDRREVDRESSAQLTLGVALPKGDRQRWMIEKAVELGVHRVVPLRTQRGVAQPVPSAVDRLQRAVVSASKQCGRTRLMEIGSPQHAESFFTASGEADAGWIAHPGGRPLAQLVDELSHWSSPAIMAVGPEGGWTDEEVQAAVTAGWRSVDLGLRILRVETAALVLATLASLRVA